MAGIFQNFLAGRQAGFAEQDRRRSIEQQEFKNQLLQRQQAMEEQRFQAEQEALNRQTRFNQLAANYLGQGTVETLGVPTTGGPPAQQLDESQGPPQYTAPARPANGPAPLSQLIGLDPARALEVEKVRQAQVTQQQGQIYNLATRALNSGKPAAMFKYLLNAGQIGDLNVGALRENMIQQGIDVDNLDDDQASKILQAISANAAAKAGIKYEPTEDIQEYEYARRQGYDGSFDKFMIDMKKAASTNVNLPAQKYPSKFADELASSDVRRLEKYEKAADGGVEMIKSLAQLKELNNTAFQGGGAELRSDIANWIQGFTGVEIADPAVLADTQKYTAIVSKSILDNLGGSLGVGVSNADLAFIKNIVPKLEFSRQARESLISYLEMRAQENIELYDKARDYAEANGGLKGFRAVEVPKKGSKKEPAKTDYSKVSDEDLLRQLGQQ